MKPMLFSLFTLLALGAAGCTTKHFTVNGLICPEGHTDQMVRHDLSECRYYDQDAAARASRPPRLEQECLECLKARGYELEQ